MKTSPIIVNEIRRLSQDEGLKDTEIATIIGYNRVSVNRIRTEYGIPVYNINNRKDNKCICPQCHKEYFIRRCEKPGICCPECAQQAEKSIHEQYAVV